MAKVVLYRPDLIDEVLPAGKLAMRRIPARGLRVMILNNGKPKTVPLLRNMVDALSERMPVASVEVFSKPSAAFTIDEATAVALSGKCDLVISGLGDCGSCSACSLQDALSLERLGVPAAVVITDPFVDVCARVSARLGYPGYVPVVVPHPVSSRSDDWLRKIAHQAGDALLPLVVPPTTVSAAS